MQPDAEAFAGEKLLLARSAYPVSLSQQLLVIAEVLAEVRALLEPHLLHEFGCQ